MKKVRKLISLALAMVMALAMCVTAYAAGETGRITVTKASKGETYTLVQLFKATYNSVDKGIVYYELVDGDTAVPGGLGTYFELKTQGASSKYIIATEAAKAADNSLSEEAVKAISDWANGLQENDPHVIEKKTASDNTVTFDNLAPGYYVVVSRSNPETGGVVSVDSFNGLTQNIADKTTTDNPHFPSDGTGKQVDKKTVAVGETVTYTVTYNTVNWMDRDNDKTNGAEVQITKYVVSDTLPDFLKDVTVTDVKVDGVSILTTGGITGINEFAKNKTFEIPWTEGEGENIRSKYQNGAVLTIIYTAVITKNILNSDSDTDASNPKNHKNEITITPNGFTPDNDDKAKTDVYTGTILVQKYAADSNGTADKTRPLAGAKFKLANGNTGDIKYAKIDETTKEVSWVGIDEATVVTTEADGVAKFEGLAKGTYYLEEIEAPVGYNKLDARQEVIVGEADTANITQPAEVVNKTGAQLPSTGGIGTTIFYVVGSILMLAAVVLFVTKKRSAER